MFSCATPQPTQHVHAQSHIHPEEGMSVMAYPVPMPLPLPISVPQRQSPPSANNGHSGGYDYTFGSDQLANVGAVGADDGIACMSGMYGNGQVGARLDMSMSNGALSRTGPAGALGQQQQQQGQQGQAQGQGPVGWSFDTFISMAPPFDPSTPATSAPMMMAGYSSHSPRANMGQPQPLPFPPPSYIQPVDADYRQQMSAAMAMSMPMPMPMAQSQSMSMSTSMPVSVSMQGQSPVTAQSQLQMSHSQLRQAVPMSGVGTQQQSWALDTAMSGGGNATKDGAQNNQPYPCPAVNLATGSRFSQLLAAKLGNVPPPNPAPSSSMGVKQEPPPMPMPTYSAEANMSSNSPWTPSFSQAPPAQTYWARPMQMPVSNTPLAQVGSNDIVPPTIPIPDMDMSSLYRISPEVQPLPVQPSQQPQQGQQMYHAVGYNTQMTVARASDLTFKVPTLSQAPVQPVQTSTHQQTWLSPFSTNSLSQSGRQGNAGPAPSPVPTPASAPVPALLRFRSPTNTSSTASGSLIQTPSSGMRSAFPQLSASPVQLANSLSASPASNGLTNVNVKCSPPAQPSMLQSAIATPAQKYVGLESTATGMTISCDQSTNTVPAPGAAMFNYTTVNPYGNASTNNGYLNMPFIPGGPAPLAADKSFIPAYPEMIYMEAAVPAKLPPPPIKTQAPEAASNRKGKGKGPKMSFSLSVPSSAGIQSAFPTNAAPVDVAASTELATGNKSEQADSSDFTQGTGDGKEGGQNGRDDAGEGGRVGGSGGSGNGSSNGGGGADTPGGSSGGGGCGDDRGSGPGSNGNGGNGAGDDKGDRDDKDDNSNANTAQAEIEDNDRKPTIACYNCRSKKLKCDGARPKCHHCTRRGEASCAYDVVLRRRGPGKKTKDKEKEKELVRLRARQEAAKREQEMLDVPLLPEDIDRPRAALSTMPLDRYSRDTSMGDIGEMRRNPSSLPSPAEIIAGSATLSPLPPRRTASPMQPHHLESLKHARGHSLSRSNAPLIPYTLNKPGPGPISTSSNGSGPRREYPSARDEMELAIGRSGSMPRGEKRYRDMMDDGEYERDQRKARYGYRHERELDHDRRYEYAGQYDRERRARYVDRDPAHEREYSGHHRDTARLLHPHERESSREYEYRYSDPPRAGYDRYEPAPAQSAWRRERDDYEPRHIDLRRELSGDMYSSHRRSISPAPYKPTTSIAPSSYAMRYGGSGSGGGSGYSPPHSGPGQMTIAQPARSRAYEYPGSGYVSGSGSEDHGPSDQHRWASSRPREADRVREGSY